MDPVTVICIVLPTLFVVFLLIGIVAWVKKKSPQTNSIARAIPANSPAATQRKSSGLGQIMLFVIMLIIIYFGLKHIQSDDPIKRADIVFKNNYHAFDDEIRDEQIVFSSDRGTIVQLRVSIGGKTFYPLVVLNKMNSDSFLHETEYEGVAIAHLGDQVISPASTEEVSQTALFYNIKH